MTTTVKPEDLACSSAACDYLKDCNGQITGSHLARVAQLFADSRVKAAEGFRKWTTAYRDEIRGIIAIPSSATEEQRTALIQRLEEMNALLAE